jgi:hypothetical protein
VPTLVAQAQVAIATPTEQQAVSAHREAAVFVKLRWYLRRAPTTPLLWVVAARATPQMAQTGTTRHFQQFHVLVAVGLQTEMAPLGVLVVVRQATQMVLVVVLVPLMKVMRVAARYPRPLPQTIQREVEVAQEQ